MNLGLRFLFSPSCSQRTNQHAIHPYAHWFSHQRTNTNLFRSITFPDVVPRLSPTFHHLPGDFLRLKPITNSESAQYDVIVTQFFIDTSFNIISTLEQIHALLKPRGMWINLGPLLWRSGAQAALELSLEEMLLLAEKVGFDFMEVGGHAGQSDENGRDFGRKSKTIECEYTADKNAMMRWVYKAEFWMAQKR